MILVLYLGIFALGQLLRINIGNNFSFPVIDLIAGIGAITFLLSNKAFYITRQNLLRLFFVIFYSLVFSLSFFTIDKIYSGALYFLRLLAYILFSNFVFNLVSLRPKLRNRLFHGLLFTIFTIVILGWIQYIFMPDLRFLSSLGWDDHYFRLVSTFLDPAFTGIILVLGTILAFFMKRKLLSLFLFLTVGFTYSRASFLALSVAAFVFFIKAKNIKLFFLYLGILISFLLILPRPGGLGVQLERTNSVVQKIANYHESLAIFEKSPVFGIGFNNLCAYRNNISSHSCGGLDNSLLVILTTTGIVGLMAFGHFGLQIYKSTSQDIYGQIFIYSAIAILVHSLFTNTLFYPHVMGWVAILIGMSRKKSSLQ